MSGNDNIHLLTTSGFTLLRIELSDYSGIWKYAEYRTFTVDNEVNKYKLVVSGYTGDAGNNCLYIVSLYLLFSKHVSLVFGVMKMTIML